jgi:hypothetical protein
MSFSGEKVGYPTQKNEALVSRVVRASSRPGDLVLDGFVGSGTTAVVAERLGRRWIACDVSPLAIHATRRRLLTLPTPAPFVVEDAGGSPPSGGALRAHAEVTGRSCTLTLDGYSPRGRAIPAEARAGVTHWSQWLEGWCVDWEYDGGALRPGSRAWRTRGTLALSAPHVHDRPGRYLARVKVFDVLGGTAARTLRVHVA